MVQKLAEFCPECAFARHSASVIYKSALGLAVYSEPSNQPCLSTNQPWLSANESIGACVTIVPCCLDVLLFGWLMRKNEAWKIGPPFSTLRIQ